MIFKSMANNNPFLIILNSTFQKKISNLSSILHSFPVHIGLCGFLAQLHKSVQSLLFWKSRQCKVMYLVKTAAVHNPQNPFLSAWVLGGTSNPLRFQTWQMTLCSSLYMVNFFGGSRPERPTCGKEDSVGMSSPILFMKEVMVVQKVTQVLSIKTSKTRFYKLPAAGK